jgi:small subunit ribosomal protein S18
MGRFQRFSPPGSPQKVKVSRRSANGTLYVDWKDVDTLRRLMSPNGKILGRKRLSVTAREQRLLSQAIKRARYMALLPYTSATL